MKNTPILYRQGDVLIESIAEIPTTAKRQRTKGPIILARGEVTGHAHAIHRGRTVFYRDVENQDISYLNVRDGDVLVEHEEHDSITLKPGQYLVRRQREYHPAEIRRVAD